jgi:hypothetical protein
MNTSGHDHDAREWEAQERARRQAHAGAAASADSPDRGSGISRELFGMATPSSASLQDAGDASYRRIAEALRHPPPVDLPSDFAARVARIAEAGVPASVPESSRLKPLPQSGKFERVLVRALTILFALCGVLVCLIYGARVFAQLQAVLGTQGVQWTALLAGCLGLSWSFEWLRRHAGHGDAMRSA